MRAEAATPPREPPPSRLSDEVAGERGTPPSALHVSREVTVFETSCKPIGGDLRRTLFTPERGRCHEAHARGSCVCGRAFCGGARPCSVEFVGDRAAEPVLRGAAEL